MTVSRPQRPESSDPRDIAMFVDSRFDAFKEDLFHHIDQKFEEQRRFLLSAYPANDPVKHLMWHQRREEQEAEHRAQPQAAGQRHDDHGGQQQHQRGGEGMVVFHATGPGRWGDYFTTPSMG